MLRRDVFLHEFVARHYKNWQMDIFNAWFNVYEVCLQKATVVPRDDGEKGIKYELWFDSREKRVTAKIIVECRICLHEFGSVGDIFVDFERHLKEWSDGKKWLGETC